MHIRDPFNAATTNFKVSNLPTVHTAPSIWSAMAPPSSSITPQSDRRKLQRDPTVTQLNDALSSTTKNTRLFRAPGPKGLRQLPCPDILPDLLFALLLDSSMSAYINGFTNNFVDLAKSQKSQKMMPMPHFCDDRLCWNPDCQVSAAHIPHTHYMC